MRILHQKKGGFGAINSLFSIAFIFIFHVSAEAAIFTAQQKGNYDQHEIWSPGFPGNVIKETDTVIVTVEVSLNIDILVKGTLIVREDAILTGAQNVIIVKSGTLFNLGKTEFGVLVNRGAIYNKEHVEVTLDFVNSGNVLNYKNISVGNVLDNTGIITGNESNITAGRKFVNSRSGILKGPIDVCSINFLNVEGGIIETEKTTFCGNPILNESGIFSRKNDEMHFEKTVAGRAVRTGEYSEF